VECCSVEEARGGRGSPSLGLPRAHARPRRASTPRPAPAAGPPPACFVPVPVPWCCGLRAAGAAAAGPAAGRTTAGPAFLAYSRPLSARGRRAHRAPRARGRPRAGRSRPGRSDRDAPRFVVVSSARPVVGRGRGGAGCVLRLLVVRITQVSGLRMTSGGGSSAVGGGPQLQLPPPRRGSVAARTDRSPASAAQTSPPEPRRPPCRRTSSRSCRGVVFILIRL